MVYWAYFRDQGSGIRDQGSGVKKNFVWKQDVTLKTNCTGRYGYWEGKRAFKTTKGYFRMERWLKCAAITNDTAQKFDFLRSHQG